MASTEKVVKEFVEEIFEPHEIEMHRYTFHPMKRTVIVHDDRNTMIPMLVHDVQDGNRIMCVFRSKQQLKDGYGQCYHNRFLIFNKEIFHIV